MLHRPIPLACVILALFVPAGLFAQTDSPPKSTQTKSKRAPLLPPGDVGFSEGVATQVLNVVRDGLHNHSASRMLQAFDRDQMPNYLAFEDQVNALFQQYESFRAYFHVLQASTEGDHGVVLVDWQVESSTGSPVPPQRRQAQLKIELAPAKKGWQIVELTPRNFFQ